MYKYAVNALRLCRFYSSQTSHNGKRFEYLQSALDNYQDTDFIPFRVKVFELGQCFTDSNLRVIQYLKDNQGLICEPESVSIKDIETGRVKPHYLSFKSMFYSGFKALEEKLSKYDNMYVENPRLSLAAEVLLIEFLHKLRFHESCLKSILKEQNEESISVLANHLFSRLTATTSARGYCVTKDRLYKSQLQKCPCALNCGEEVLLDSTGVGSELLWYGRPDIMIFPMNCGIVVVPEEFDEDEIEDERSLEGTGELNNQSIEIQPGISLRSQKNIKRITSMAITFSLYQNMHQKSIRKDNFQFVSVVPFIAASLRSFDIYLYDSENDILLRNMGPPLSLWEDDLVRNPKLNLSSVLKLWMTINYMAIVPTLTTSDVNLLYGSCEFLSNMDKNLVKDILGTLRMSDRFYPKKIPEFSCFSDGVLKYPI